MADPKLPDFLSDVVNPMSIPDVPTIEIPQSINFPGGSVPPITGQYAKPPDTGSEFATALKHHFENPEAYATDKYKYGKNYAYDADYTGANFERYYKTPRLYKKLGFSPWRDNESLYNSEITWFDDWKRSLGQSANLGIVGAKSMLPWNAWEFDATDTESAQLMEKAHAIGHSNKKGIGGFFNNLTLDAGYTLGIGAEFAAEEVITLAAGAALAPFTEGGSFAVALGKSADNLRKGYKAWNRMSKLQSFGRSVGKSAEALNELRNISKARQVFNYAKSGRAVEDIVKILTPSTATFGKDLYKTVKQGHTVKTFAVASRGVGAFYRDMREVAAALSEAKLEGGSTERDLFQKLNDEFYAKNGRTPNSEESDVIKQMSADAGKETFLWNLPALWISNKIVFDTALKGLPSMRALRAGSLDIGSSSFKRTMANTATDKNVWEKVESGFVNRLKSLGKKETWKPKTILKGGLYSGLVYTTKNLTEGAQEVYQDAASEGIKDYYTGLYTDPLNVSTHSAWGSFSNKLQDQVTSKRGLETFASGFLMGALVQVPQHLVYSWAPTKFSELRNSQDFQDNRAEKARREDELITALNVVGKDPMKFHNILVENLVKLKQTQTDMVTALENGDVKLYKDLKSSGELNHIITLLESGKLGVVEEYLTDLKSLSGEELVQAFGEVEESKGDPKQHYDSNIDDMIQSIKMVKNRQEYFDDVFSNPFDPNQYSKQQEPERYNQEVHSWAAFQSVRRDAILSMSEFEDVSKRMSQIIDTVSRNARIAEASSHDFSVLFDEDSLTDELTTLSAEVSTIDITTAEGRREKKVKLKKLQLLSTFQNDLTLYLNSSGKFGEKTEEELNERKESARKNLKKSYTNYMKSLSKGQTSMLTDIINESFSQLEDYYSLRLDKTEMAKVIDDLHNPQKFVRAVERMSKIKEDFFDRRHENWQEAIKKDFADKDFNALLNQLNSLGVFIDEDEIQNLKDKLIPPAYLENIVSKKPAEGELLAKANQLIDAYIEVRKSDVGTKTENVTAENILPDGIIPGENGETPSKFIFKGDLYEIRADKFFKNNVEITQDELLSQLTALQASMEVKPTEPVVDTTPKDLTKIAEVKEALKKLNEKTYVLIPGDKNHYVNENDPADIAKRVSTLKGSDPNIDEIHSKRGNIIDTLVREFFGKKIKDFNDLKKIYKSHPDANKVVFTDPFIRDIYNILQKIEKIVENQGVEIISDIPTLWGQLNGETYAGTIDLLGINKQGEVFIIDLKTSSGNRRTQYALEAKLKHLAGEQYKAISDKIKATEHKNVFEAEFNAEEQIIIDEFLKEFASEIREFNGKKSLSIYFYSEADSIQQSAYAELLRQRTGIKVKNITIFPIQVSTTKGVYTAAKASTTQNKKGDLVYTMHAIVDKTIFPDTSTAGTMTQTTPYGTEKGPTLTTAPSDRKVTAEDRTRLRELKDSDEERVDLTDTEIINIIDNNTTAEEYREKILVDQIFENAQNNAKKVGLLKGIEDAVKDIKTYDELQVFKKELKPKKQQLFREGIKGDELDEILDKREQELLFTVTFAELKVGDAVLTKKERRIMIVAVKTEDNIVLNPYNNPKLSKLVLKSSEVEDALLFKERPGVTKAIQSVEISESDLKKSNEDVQSVPASAADLLKEKPKTVKEIKAQLKQNQKDREDNCKIG